VGGNPDERSRDRVGGASCRRRASCRLRRLAHAPGKPTVLIYGHFDTQPVDPLELWDSPPFEPVVKEGRIVGPGFHGRQGQHVRPILVAEAMLKTGGRLPVNLKFLFEGEEEIASPSLPKFIVKNKDCCRATWCSALTAASGQKISRLWPSDQRGYFSVCGCPGAGSRCSLRDLRRRYRQPIHALVQILTPCTMRTASHGEGFL